MKSDLVFGADATEVRYHSVFIYISMHEFVVKLSRRSEEERVSPQ